MKNFEPRLTIATSQPQYKQGHLLCFFEREGDPLCASIYRGSGLDSMVPQSHFFKYWNGSKLARFATCFFQTAKYSPPILNARNVSVLLHWIYKVSFIGSCLSGYWVYAYQVHVYLFLWPPRWNGTKCPSIFISFLLPESSHALSQCTTYYCVALKNLSHILLFHDVMWF